MAKKKVCSFCGNEYKSDDKSVVLFKSSAEDSDIRICSDCIKKCSEIYNEKMSKMKQKEIQGKALNLTPKEIFNKLNEWVLDQDPAMKKIARSYLFNLFK